MSVLGDGPVTLVVPTADAMRDLGISLGAACSGGDVLVLSGDLGAGKTTLTQGLAIGMGIREPVTSPTFVIARVHRNEGGGPDLVHVDAYRLGSRLELEDLGLEADLPFSVVVVEWGAGLAEALADEWLDLLLERSDDEDDETRTVTLVSRGARWRSVLSAVAEWTGTRWSSSAPISTRAAMPRCSRRCSPRCWPVRTVAR